MGFLKRRLARGAVETVIQGNGAGRLIRKLKKIIIVALVCGLVLLIGGVAILGYTFSKVSNMVTANPDAELVALERLITAKAIVLTQEQKARLAPVIKDLGKPGQPPEQTKALKEKVWGILDPAQVKAVTDWRVKAEKEAGTLVEAGKSSVSEALSNYTGISPENAKKTIDNLSGWWQLKGSQNGSVDNLQKAVEGK